MGTFSSKVAQEEKPAHGCKSAFFAKSKLGKLLNSVGVVPLVRFSAHTCQVSQSLKNKKATPL
jgi:hypothetical protein